MHNNDRPLWSEGMFLGPQHFQQHDRFLLDSLSQLAKSLGAWNHGLIELEINTAALNEGCFALNRVSGLFPDGTPFNLPSDGELPMPISIDANCRDTLICLALPFAGQQDKDIAEERSAASFARYLIDERLVSDRHSPDAHGEETVFTARLWTRLLAANDELGAFHTLPLARISERRDDDRVVLDEHFYPCAMTLQASPALQALVHELAGILHQRANELAARIGRATASDTSQLQHLLMLQIINRATPLLRHIEQAPSTHPERLYRDLVQLAGELATLTSPSRLAPVLTPYRHRDQYQSFTPLIQHLRESLNWIPESTTESIPVHHVKAGIYTAAIRNSDLFAQSRFILAVKAQVTPEELSRRLPRQATISCKARLRDLVETQSRGIAIKPVIMLPNSIPTYENHVYFDLHDDDPLWQEIATSGDLAMHIAGSYRDLQMQLWAVQR